MNRNIHIFQLNRLFTLYLYYSQLKYSQQLDWSKSDLKVQSIIRSMLHSSYYYYYLSHDIVTSMLLGSTSSKTQLHPVCKIWLWFCIMGHPCSITLKCSSYLFKKLVKKKRGRWYIRLNVSRYSAIHCLVKWNGWLELIWETMHRFWTF